MEVILAVVSFQPMAITLRSPADSGFARETSTFVWLLWGVAAATCLNEARDGSVVVVVGATVVVVTGTVVVVTGTVVVVTGTVVVLKATACATQPPGEPVVEAA